jgi:hypothetical protein
MFRTTEPRFYKLTFISGFIHGRLLRESRGCYK